MRRLSDTSCRLVATLIYGVSLVGRIEFEREEEAKNLETYLEYRSMEEKINTFIYYYTQT